MLQKDGEYTSIDFLSKIRLQPKKHLFKQLSLDTDLEEINQVLSPKAQPHPQHHSPPALDRQLTKRFVQQLITAYEGENEATSKWEAFLKSLETPQSFEIFVSSLKLIREPKKEQPPVNPESNAEKDPKGERKPVRSLSVKRALRAQARKEGGREREKMREQVGALRDLLMAGERFMRASE